MVAPAPPAKAGRPGGSAGLAPVGHALRSSDTLASLLARLAQSQARFVVAAAALPPELAAVVRPGPLDDQAWRLLADHAAAAAKLRQCLPAIEAALSANGWPAPPVKVKVRPRGS